MSEREVLKKNFNEESVKNFIKNGMKNFKELVDDDVNESILT